MKKIVFKGKNAEEATDGALQILGLARDQANVKILSEGKPGMLGMIGGEEAEVEVTEKVDPSELARQVLQEMLDKMGLLAIAEVNSDIKDTIVLTIKGEDLGRIIGKEGNMLMSLQVLVSSIVCKALGEKQYIEVDAGGYKEKHEGALIRLAREAAKDVVKTSIEKPLPPMNAHDRRVIHMALKDDTSIRTYSEGVGSDRRLIIAPK